MKNDLPAWLLLLIGALLFSTCSKEQTPAAGSGVNYSGEWLIPLNEVYDGGPGKDGIPSVDEPNFTDINGIDFLEEEDLVIGIKYGNTIRVYPHAILDWHEIVNDNIGGLKLALTYCPLTGTGIGWKRVLDGEETTFGVSGLLYNSNLIPYDRATDSNWSQMRLDCVNGALSGERIETYPVLETTWATWKSLYPDSEIMNTATGYNRQYGVYPYGSYKINGAFLFPPDPIDERIFVKERVLGIIIDGEAKAYRFDLFPEEEIGLINDNFNGMDLIIAGSSGKNFMAPFRSTTSDGTALSFTAVQDELPVIMEDQEGNKWSIFGEAVEGPRTGEQLISPEGYIGYWFSFGAFYPGLEIME